MGAAATSRRAERISAVRLLARSRRVGRRRPFSKLRRIHGAPHSGGRARASGQPSGEWPRFRSGPRGRFGRRSCAKGLNRADRAPGGGILATRSSHAVSASHRRCCEAASARRSDRQTRLLGFTSFSAAGATSAKTRFPRTNQIRAVELGTNYIDQICHFPDQISHFQGECETSERPTDILKWERFLENA